MVILEVKDQLFSQLMGTIITKVISKLLVIRKAPH